MLPERRDASFRAKRLRGRSSLRRPNSHLLWGNDPILWGSILRLQSSNVTSSPSFGLVLPSSGGSDVPDPDAIWPIVERADESGLDYLWVSDHIVWWHPMYESLALLSAVAARTLRIKIGTAVLLLAMRDPVVTAKTLASIDRLSSGRLTVGVGIGGEFPPEWAAVGVPTRTRATRTEEMIEALRGLWGEGSFGYHGKRIGFEAINLYPKPRNRPPIWIGGRSEGAVKRAARLGDGWMGLFLTPERYEKGLTMLRDEAEALGRDPEAIARSLYVWTCIADTDAEARSIAENLMGGFYNLPFEKLEKYVVAGSAQTCAERFSEFVSAGVNDFAIAIIGTPGAEIVDRISTEIIPSVRS